MHLVLNPDDFTLGLAVGVLDLVVLTSLALLVFHLFTPGDTAGPWKWLLVIWHTAGLMVALLFLSNLANTGQAMQSYWPVVLMLQLPPVYLSLVWRSRMLSELKLRSAAAEVTALATRLVVDDGYNPEHFKVVSSF